MQCPSHNKTMRELIAAVTMLLLVLQMPGSSSAEFTVLHSASVTPPTRPIMAESKLPKQSAVAVDLMHYHHVNSPYSQPNLTLTQRAEIAVKSSQARAETFARKFVSKLDSKIVFTTPDYYYDGSYIMKLSLGTPARDLLAIADTGSSYVWVQCVGCGSNCFQEPDPIFDPNASSTYEPVNCTSALCTALNSTPSCAPTGTCTFYEQYADNSSTQGDWAHETINLNSSTGSTVSETNLLFGCATNSQEFGNEGVDGLVGLSQGVISLVSQLGDLIGGVFSYCLVSFSNSTTKTSPLLLGSVGDLALTYTPLINNTFDPEHYYVNLVGITVDGQQLNYPSDTFIIDPTTGGGGLILDSGTTVTSLAAAAYVPLLNTLASLISYPAFNGTSLGYDLCYDASNSGSPVQFPTVVMQFESLDVSLPEDNLFMLVTDPSTYCLAMQSLDAIADSISNSIYGSFQQQNFQIAYDIANARIGMAPTTC